MLRLFLGNSLCFSPIISSIAPKALVANNFALVRESKLVEFRILKVSPFIADLGPAVGLVDHSYAFAGESLVVTAGIHDI